MADYEADVIPDQDWEEDGTATVTPKAPFPNTNPVELPLEHRDGGPVTVLRSAYPSGMVIIPNDTPPEGPMATLPMEASSGNSINISNGAHVEWPEGIVALFTD
ncbi:MAG: hypothetical protein ACW99G_04765 [Candidatus Thorarchaeota archaeon]|jgi:hypothetical protein